MGISGIDGVVFGVADLTEAKRFLDDWGTSPIAADPDRLLYQTKDKGQIIVRRHDDPTLPAPIEAGNTVREVIWGAPDAASLTETLDALRRTGTDPIIGADGTARITDPNGLSLAFRVTQRSAITVLATPANGPGAPQRIDRRSPVIDHAEPACIGHIVVFANDFAAMRDFYTQRLGFTVSDEYPGHGVFLRCQVRGAHHNLFILNRPGKPGINHVAFTVADIHEVIGGGIAMAKKGWKTEIGPGRHPISSAYFGYFHNPLGAPLEYYADDDYCTEAWKPESFTRKPELFAEWAIAGGIDGTTRRQIVAVDNSVRGHA
jgi:catechol 2,3-dioxygenase-like lactoylglutathione lyase family enzyme